MVNKYGDGEIVTEHVKQNICFSSYLLLAYKIAIIDRIFAFVHIGIQD